MVPRPIKPPPYPLVAFEQLAVLEYASFLAARPLLRLPEGDGHPVLVLPGFQAGDRSTAPLRATLRARGHRVYGWRLGRNAGPHAHVVTGMRDRLLALCDRYGRRVSLVGWSLGGIYARELARAHPDAVRQVITLASPYRFRPVDRGTVSALYDLLGPAENPFPHHRLPEPDRPELTVPRTSIYTRSDGIVRWHTCIESAGYRRENIEVIATHTGLAYNLATVIALADRLAQPEGRWAPFSPPWAVRHLFPRPVSWVPPEARGDRRRTARSPRP